MADDHCDDVEVGQITPLASTDPEGTPGYKAPAVKSLAEIKCLDEDDESLVRYKQTLLNDTDLGACPPDDPRTLIVEKMAFVVDGKDIAVFDLTGDLKNFQKMVVKEGVDYRIRIEFKVHHDLVCGLCYHHVIKRKGISVDKHTYMVGSYGPKKETQSWLSPFDEAPKGKLYRGTYKIQSRFIDDDNDKHLEWDWEMDIKKDWA